MTAPSVTLTRRREAARSGPNGHHLMADAENPMNRNLLSLLLAPAISVSGCGSSEDGASAPWKTANAFSTSAPVRRPDVRMEESGPQFVAVLMVGGEPSTENDSTRIRSSPGLYPKPLALERCLQAASRRSSFLTTPPPLLTYTLAQTNLSLTFCLRRSGGPYIPDRPSTAHGEG